MSFTDLDAAELKLEKSVTDITTARQLFNYAYEMFGLTFGYKMPTDFLKDQAVLKWVLKTYGNDGAKLVKWLFYRYEGEIDGEVFAVNWFASGHKWRIDKELFVMKKALNEVKPVLKSTRKIGFMSVKEMLASGASTS